MAVRTGDEPPRQRLQRLLDEAVKDKPTAPELAERLQAAGVGVRANLASTGRMNGFSFEVAGVAFKGSDLGKGYTWAGLQKAGVTYDEAETVRALNDSGPQLQIVESVRTLQQSVSLMHEDLKRLPGAVSTETAQTLEPLARLRQDVTQVLEAYDKVTAIQRKTLDELTQQMSASAAQAFEQKAGKLDATISDLSRSLSGLKTSLSSMEQTAQQSGEPAGQAGERTAGHDEGRRPTDRGSERDAPAPLAAGAGADSGRGRGRDAGSDWASRFKQASAAKRRAADGGLGQNHLEQGHAQGTRVAEADRQSARELRPDRLP